MQLCIHSLSTFTLTQCPIYRTESGNTFAWITVTTHACTNFFKILQHSSIFCKTQHVLYFLNGGSRISNMTFPCVMKVINVMTVMKVMRAYLHISEFLCISKHIVFKITFRRLYRKVCVTTTFKNLFFYMDRKQLEGDLNFRWPFIWKLNYALIRFNGSDKFTNGLESSV